MGVDAVRCQKGNVVEKTQVCGMEECLCWWAEKCLVHEFHMVAEVRDCVDIVH